MAWIENPNRRVNVVEVDDQLALPCLDPESRQDFWGARLDGAAASQRHVELASAGQVLSANSQGTLLPNLLPNSVARDGTRTDRGRFRERKSQTIRDVLGRLDTSPRRPQPNLETGALPVELHS
jgi:hypothetical protein